jgi:hypothetical protein
MSKKTLFDLRDHSSIDLDRLNMSINSGVKEAKELGLKELEETLLGFRVLVDAAFRIACEREAESFMAEQSRKIQNGTL